DQPAPSTQRPASLTPVRHRHRIKHMTNLAVAVDDLHVRRGGREVLQGVSFALERGSVTGVLGPSGCGKSTLLRAIVGVQIVAGGSVTVLGLPAGHKDLRRKIGYATQIPAIYPDLRVAEALRYFASVLGRLPRTWTGSSTRSGSARTRTRWSGSCPAASSAAPIWRWPCSASPSCWCSTNRRWAWIRCCVTSCGSCSVHWPAAARPCWCPAT